MTPHVAVDQVSLGNPVALRYQIHRVPGYSLDAVLPHLKDLGLLGAHVAVLCEPECTLEKLGLHVKSAHLTAVGQTNGSPTGRVVADLTDSPDRVLQGHVTQDHVGLLQHSKEYPARAHLQKGGVLAHVGVTHDHMQSPEAFGIGMRFVPRVDYWP